MVAEQTSKRKTIIVCAVIFVLVAAFSFAVARLLNSPGVGQGETFVKDIDDIDEPEEEMEPELPEAINLQSVVDEWVASVSGNRSVLIYDVDRDEVAASYSVLENYNTASLYKLFVVYEGYRRVASGAWDGNAVISENHTVLDCLDLAIRESYSPCAERLWAMIGHDELDRIMAEEWGIVDSDISILISKVGDINKMMLRFYKHPDFENAELVARMWDSFLNQPKTTYDWRQGLPSGFSAEVDVYNKVGWAWNAEKRYWNIYHDTAIVHFKNLDRTFVVTVMTNYVDHRDISRLGRMIEAAVNSVAA